MAIRCLGGAIIGRLAAACPHGCSSALRMVESSWRTILLLSTLLLATLLLTAVVGADALAAVCWLEIRQVALQGTSQDHIEILGTWVAWHGFSPHVTKVMCAVERAAARASPLAQAH